MKKQGNELFVNLSLVIDYLNARGGSKQPASDQQATSKQPASNQQATSKQPASNQQRPAGNQQATSKQPANISNNQQQGSQSWSTPRAIQRRMTPRRRN